MGGRGFYESGGMGRGGGRQPYPSGWTGVRRGLGLAAGGDRGSYPRLT